MPFVSIIFFGILSASFALMLELLTSLLASFFGPGLHINLDPILTGTAFSATIVLTLVGIAFIEEYSKYLFLRQYALRYFLTTASTIRGATVLSVLFGIGFTSLETALIISGLTPFVPVALLGVALLHIATSFIFSFYLFSYSDERPWFPLGLLFLATLTHTLYNIAIFFLS